MSMASEKVSEKSRIDSLEAARRLLCVGAPPENRSRPNRSGSEVLLHSGRSRSEVLLHRGRCLGEVPGQSSRREASN